MSEEQGAVPVRSGPPGASSPLDLRLEDLDGAARDEAIPVIIDSFEGIYRWHAKRTLRSVTWVRGARAGNGLVGVAMLDRLTPEVGYVYYLAVLRAARGRGVGGRLLEDALARFRSQRLGVVYAATEEDNAPSLALFRSRGFREVTRDEPGYRDGGLGAWGLRSRMMVVHGETLLGRRLPLGPTVDETPSGRPVPSR